MGRLRGISRVSLGVQGLGFVLPRSPRTRRRDVAPWPLDIELNVGPEAQSVQTSSNSSSGFWVRTLRFTSPRVGGLCYGLGLFQSSLMSMNQRASLVPAAGVIPFPIAYIKVV